ncbi:hypothetical protein [Herbaspirillum huttiense]|uniref:hypothetical protein n=1 Tax=Herbaspirillum huttiense TaxID=863372 RepID=UPI0031D6AE0E
MAEDSTQQNPLLTLTEQKELAQTEEARAKTLATHIDMVCKLVPAVLIGYGVILSFLYFSRALNFFPSGLNTGDTLLLIFVTLGYTLFFWAIAGSGMILLTPVSIFKERVDSHIKGLPSVKMPPEIFIYVALGLGIPILAGKYFLEDVSSDRSLYLRLFLVVVISIALIAIARYHGNKRGDALRGIAGTLRATNHDGQDQPPAETESRPPDTFWAALADVVMKSIIYLGGLFFAIVSIHYGHNAGVLLVITACGSGVVLFLAADSLDQKQTQYSNKFFKYKLALPLVLVAISSSIPLYWDGTQGQYKLTKSVFNWVGLNSADATVILTGSALSALEEQNSESDLHLDICNDKSGNATVSGIDILWHGMGTRSLLRLGGKGKPEFEANSKDVTLVRNVGRRCHELTSTVHFPSGKATPINKEQIENLRAEFSQVVSSKKEPWKLVQVDFIGYADPLPLEKGNQQLSLARAQRLRDDLEEIIPEDAQSTKRKLVANGARATDYTKCAAIADPKLLSECYEVNRRASVKLYFEASKATTDTEEK